MDIKQLIMYVFIFPINLFSILLYNLFLQQTCLYIVWYHAALTGLSWPLQIPGLSEQISVAGK